MDRSQQYPFMVDWYPSQGYTGSVINAVRIGKRAQKQIGKAPRHIADKLFVWIRSVKLLASMKRVRPLAGMTSR